MAAGAIPRLISILVERAPTAHFDDIEEPCFALLNVATLSPSGREAVLPAVPLIVHARGFCTGSSAYHLLTALGFSWKGPPF